VPLKSNSENWRIHTEFILLLPIHPFLILSNTFAVLIEEHRFVACLYPEDIAFRIQHPVTFALKETFAASQDACLLQKSEIHSRNPSSDIPVGFEVTWIPLFAYLSL